MLAEDLYRTNLARHLWAGAASCRMSEGTSLAAGRCVLAFDAKKALQIQDRERGVVAHCVSSAGSPSNHYGLSVLAKHFAQGVGNFADRGIGLDCGQNMRHQIRAR